MARRAYALAMRMHRLARRPLLLLASTALLGTGGCAATVPLEQHEALETRLAELQEAQEALIADTQELRDHKERLTAMVAAQRMIIRDLRCRPMVEIKPE